MIILPEQCALADKAVFLATEKIGIFIDIFNLKTRCYFRTQQDFENSPF
jgi:hypothetical protein